MVAFLIKLHSNNSLGGLHASKRPSRYASDLKVVPREGGEGGGRDELYALCWCLHCMMSSACLGRLIILAECRSQLIKIVKHTGVYAVFMHTSLLTCYVPAYRAWGGLQGRMQYRGMYSL